MTYLRREVTEFIRVSDLLLHGDSMSTPLMETEKGLMEAYVIRLCEELKLSIEPSLNRDQSQPDRRHKASA
jgi:hypothetical protein